jgi:hypothetical protein
MNIDMTKLENAVCTMKDGIDVIIARCPACAEDGRDNKGDHLIVFPDGRFGCVVNPVEQEDSAEHRKRIFALVGIKAQRPALPINRYSPKVPLLAVPNRVQIVTFKPKQ